MFNKKLTNSDEGVVGIVASFLIIGLIVAVISVIQTVYVPKWMEEKEAEHMEEVANQFAQLKYAIDMHVSTASEKNPISVPITLGSKELPYFLSIRAFGTLEIIDNACNISIKSNNQIFSINIGIIKFSSLNGYFIDQSYIYENGALILSQDNGNSINFDPSFKFTPIDFYNVSLDLDIVNITPLANKGSISGYATYPIKTEFLESSELLPEINNISEIRIKTDFTDAWYSFIKSRLINSRFDNSYYNISKNQTEVNITFYNKLYNINVTINSPNINLEESRIYNIGAQIAPGWVINTKS